MSNWSSKLSVFYSQLQSYRSNSLQQILEHQLVNPRQNTWVIILGRASTQQCNPRSLQIVLDLLQRDGEKWLQVIKRFSYLQFKLVFSFTIKKIKAYPAIIESVYKLGSPQHQALFQQNIENAIDRQMSISRVGDVKIWPIYLKYLKECKNNVPHRTIFALQKIEKRLAEKDNIYQNLQQKEKITFIQILSQIIKLHEQDFVRKLSLRKFWQSIPQIIIYMKQSLYYSGLINKMVIRLSSDEEENLSQEQRQKQTQQKEKLVMCLMKTCQVNIFQDIFISQAPRIVIELINKKIIEYRKYRKENMQQFFELQHSLIYHVRSDDLASLLEQLITNLSLNVPNFLSIFISQSLFFLSNQKQDEICISDLILKLCILSKLIIQHCQNIGLTINIKQIVDKLILFSQNFSQLIQVKTLTLMHYFRQVLPEEYFVKYHQIIFKILKSVITQKAIIQNHQNQTLHFQNNQIEYFSFNSQHYSQISFYQCIKILQEETQSKQDEQSIQMRIRKKKTINWKKSSDLFFKNILSFSDKLIELIQIKGYCQQQQVKVLQIVKNILEKYPQIQQRNTEYLTKIFTHQFILEYERLKQLHQRQRSYLKGQLLLNCLQLILNHVNEEIYLNCQQHLVAIVSLLLQPNVIEFQDQIFQIIATLIEKANLITPWLNNFIIYARQSLLNTKGSICVLNKIIKQICKPSLVKCINQDWSGLVLMFTQLFLDYLTFSIYNQIDSFYKKEWVEAVHLIMLFLQSYQNQYQLHFDSANILYRILNIFQSQKLPEEAWQIIMTVHHILPNCRIQLQSLISNLTVFKQKFSFNLFQITMADVLAEKLRMNEFDFSDSRNGIYPFLDIFIANRLKIKDTQLSKESTPNDLLPFNKIDPDRYILSILQSLFRQKRIDIQEFTELKNKLVDQIYLIKSQLFR